MRLPILVSQEGLILDGHHRWVAQSEINPEGKMPVIMAECPIKELVELGHEFDGSEVKSVYEITTYGQALFDEHDFDGTENNELMVRKILRPKGN